jgi:hypothetical protein
VRPLRQSRMRGDLSPHLRPRNERIARTTTMTPIIQKMLFIVSISRRTVSVQPQR